MPLNILFTGASSFTGYWFIKKLVSTGATVTGTFRSPIRNYNEERGIRVKQITQNITSAVGIEFGDDNFIELLDERFDVLCMHGAEMANYRSWDFDPIAAAQKNTNSLRVTLERFKSRGGKAILFTGSVFEPHEGAGDKDLQALNPYGLSKSISFEILKMEAERINLPIAKFVIPNPFGELEDFKFTSFLCKSWSGNKVPEVKTPLYIRDNIPVDLLAKAYVNFIFEAIESSHSFFKLNPSGYVSSQRDFALKLKSMIEGKLHEDLPITFADQAVIDEPLVRINTHPAINYVDDWDEGKFWDSLTDFYIKSNWNK